MNSTPFSFLSLLRSKPLPQDWTELLADQFEKPYMLELEKFLNAEYKKGKEIYPQKDDIFSSLRLTPLSKVKVVIIGQDPYHGKGQAHGLAFSVRPNVVIPPSLQNIYQELENDLAIPRHNSGDLRTWARQGVMLLNSVLTVEASKAHSHKHRGWEFFTDKIVDIINVHKKNVVFLLWGRPAREKGKNIDKSKHIVLETVHPSPLSAHNGFFGSKHFSRTNNYLKKNGLDPINWNLAETSKLDTPPTKSHPFSHVEKEIQQSLF